MSAPKFFKDFNKDTKDLLTKQYTAGSDWKLENKIKPDNKTFILNPGFEAKKGKVRVSVDVDYNVKEYNIETKTTVYQDGGIKPKLTWKSGSTKVEYTLSNIELKSFPYSPESDFELTGETFVPAVGLALYDKFGAKDFEVGVSGSLFFLKNLTLGGSLNLEYPLAFKGWNAGVRYAQDGYIFNVTTTGLKTFTTGVFAPIAIAGVPLKVAAQVDCGAKKFDATVGVEAALSDVTVKAKVNSSLNVTVAVIRKLTDKWTTALTFNVAAAPSIGVSITRE